ncbi:acyltransferase [Ferrimonas lipolytica]|uniref:Acyltransferase n=1 Tax=Ferrimonas lipolytica TaxID=2724191 RepID=A0A6H1UG47_9GAMM|nr:acyltransferase [Ferrimonas lipolytica]QIZ78077.1 acyltransferase [Ferrimonas lipolytica]
MLSCLPAPLIAALVLSTASINIAFWGTLIVLLSPFKALLPFARQPISELSNQLMAGWVACNEALLKTFTPTQWHIQGLEQQLDKNGSYLIVCNHLSGMDIAVVTIALRRHVPMLKFFLKQQLLYVPFLGAACWALDMPFMQRYTKSQIAKNPKLKGSDIDTTRRSCEKFLNIPTCVINYVEGSRLTLEKHQRQNSPFTYLLKPKAGGIAFAMSTLGDQFDHVLDLTVVYPGTPDGIMASFVSGKVEHVAVDINVIPMSELPQGNYDKDKAYRVEFQAWLNQVWQRKDRLIGQLLMQYQPNKAVQGFYQAIASK